MQEKYKLEKWIWNQDDFEQMGWHDNPIWAMSFDDNIKFDLDYIFTWVHPKNEGGSFKFWISPATLVFKNPSNFKVELETDFVNGLEIAEIIKEKINGKTIYIIEAQEGKITIQTEEFYQIIRRPPTLQISQALMEIERGPLSFSEIPEKLYKPTAKQLRCRKLTHKLSDLRNIRTQLQIYLEDEKFGSVSPKERIIIRREHKSKIKSLSKEIEMLEDELLKI